MIYVEGSERLSDNVSEAIKLYGNEFEGIIIPMTLRDY